MAGDKRPDRRSRIDPAALAAFRQGLRRRYTDDELLTEIRASAKRLGLSPTMRELADDPGAAIHPQTIVDRFGSWNEAKRRAGLVPRRFATKDDLLRQLRELGEALGRTPTIKDLDANRKRMPSKSLYWQTFGSFTEALKQAGFAVVVGEERLDLAIERGAVIAQEIGRLPKFSDWKAARLADPTLPTEWQVYRLLDPTQGAWPTFQYFVRERLLEAGVTVRSDGRLVT